MHHSTKRLLGAAIVIVGSVVLMVFSFLPVGSKTPVAYATRIPATCNDTTSDAATLNSTIVSSHAGDEIDIQGPCLITATITLLGDRTYKGDSRSGTVLQQAAGANLSAIFASDSFVNDTTTTGDPIAIRDLTIDGNKANNTAATDGIVLRSWLSDIEDVQIENMGGNGIRETNLSANGTTLTNTQVNGRIVGNFIHDCDNDGVYIQDSGNVVTDTTLADNWISDSGVDGIHMENAAGWMIERNHLYGNQQNGIYANRAYGTTISDNYIEDFGDTTTAGTWYGIKATIQGGAATTMMGNRIFDFHGENSNSTYIYLGVIVNYGTGDVSVTGNTIRGAGSSTSTGLYYSKGNGAGLTVTSTGNMVDGVHTTRTVGTGVTLTAGL
jgi:parallel beta-helix repeat protein/putative cofactor-binding repeat protein